MIRDAVAVVNVVPSCVLLVRGSLLPHWASVAQLWRFLLRTSSGHPFTQHRRGATVLWHDIPQDRQEADALIDKVPLGGGCRWFEAASSDKHDALHLEVSDLAPVAGTERTSHIRLRFPKDVAPSHIVHFAEFAIQNLPLWWGSAGFAFEHVSGPRLIAYRRIAALAKRYWGVQIQDLSTLQWDASACMLDINWLTLVGDEFAKSAGVDIDKIIDKAAPWVGDGVYHRKGQQGVVIAAGAQPTTGDINIGKNLGARVRVATLLAPLLLGQPTLLAGPFAKQEILAAWRGRFGDPQNWLRCRITDD